MSVSVNPPCDAHVSTVPCCTRVTHICADIPVSSCCCRTSCLRWSHALSLFVASRAFAYALFVYTLIEHRTILPATLRSDAQLKRVRILPAFSSCTLRFRRMTVVGFLTVLIHALHLHGSDQIAAFVQATLQSD